MDDPSTEDLPRTLRGRFWFPEHPTLILDGELIVSTPHGYDLQLDLPHYGLGHPGYWESLIGKPVATILGMLDDGRPITCSDCGLYSSGAAYKAPHAVSWHRLRLFAHRCLLGAHVDNFANIQFRQFSSYFTGFNEWAATSEQELFAEAPDNEVSRIKRTDEIQRFGQIQIWRAGGCRVTHADVSRRNEVRYWRPSFEPLYPVTVGQMLDTIRGFQRLQCLLQGRPVGFNDVRAEAVRVGNGGNRSTEAEDVEIMVMMTGYKQPLTAGPADGLLVPLTAAENTWPAIVKEWFGWSGDKAAVLNLYFAVVFGTDLFEEHKFLFLAQAIEGYHRIWIGPRRAPFIHRLLEVSGPLTQFLQIFIGDVPKFCEDVKDLRNDLTHPGLHAGAPVMPDVQRMWKELRTVLEICFLRDLAVGPEVLERVAKLHAWR